MAYRETPMTPVLFSTPLATINPGTVVIPDMSLMASQMRRPMLVDEIRWTYVSATGVSTLMNLGGMIQCKLAFGRLALTGSRDGGNFVPIWNFGPPHHAVDYSEFAVDGGAGVLANVSAGYYRWKLPKPLYVPVGQSLVPSFYGAFPEYVWGGKVGIAVVGRQFGDAGHPMPSKIDVPYVAYYQPPSGKTTAISSELDFVNPFLVDLNVQRFICRQARLTFQLSQLAQFEESLSVDGASAISEVANVVMKDSAGMNVVRDVIPLGNVFEAPHRTWTFQRVLKPKERYLIELSALSVATNFNIPMFSMIGSREEVFK